MPGWAVMVLWVWGNRDDGMVRRAAVPLAVVSVIKERWGVRRVATI